MPDSRPENPTVPDDNELLTRFQSRDRAAFDQLFDRYSGRVLTFCLRLTGSRADAEDLVSETFLAAYQGQERFRGGSRLLTYFIAIALRRFRDGKRRRHVLTTTLHDETETENARHCSSTESTVVSGVAFQTALAALDEPLRIAFLLVAAQGMTHKEAAEILKAPIGTVKWRVAEATRRLRTALQEDYDNEPTSQTTAISLPQVRPR